MKLFTTLTLFLVSFNFLYSQETASYGIEIFPKIVSYSHDGEIIESNNTVGVSVAGNVYIKIGEKLSFKTGVGINTLKLSIKDFSPTFPCDSDGTGGVNIKNSWSEFNFPLIYFSLPAQIKWDLSKNEKHFYLRVGVETFIRLRSQGTHEVYECGSNSLKVEGTLGGISTILIMSGLGIGYEFPIKENRTFYIEPSLQYSLSNIFDGEKPVIGGTNVSANGNFANFGLALGMLF